MPSHKITFPRSSWSTRFSESLFAGLYSTHPGKSIKGVPICKVTGRAVGIEVSGGTKYSGILLICKLETIFISLIPISKKAFYWNQCFKKTFKWIDKYEMELNNWDKASKESIAVAVCNGAVYEPELKTK